MEPKKFLENMVLVKLESPGNSLEDLAYEFDKNDNCIITKQALHKKFNKSAVEFMQRVLNKLLDQAFHSSTYLGAIPFVKTIQVIDSSEIRLHPKLKTLFPQVRNQGAAVKLQSLMDVISQEILSLEICSSKASDQGYKNHIAHVQANDLLIGDLGYFCVETFKEIASKGSFFLSRYFKKTNLYHLNTKELVDLRTLLHETQAKKIELQIGLGLSQFPCRLVAIKLTEEAYQKRLKYLKEKQRKDPRAKKNSDLLEQWTILVTNLPTSIEAEILLRLYSLRWQIELFFKMAKTFLKLREMKENHQQRAIMSLYVTLIAIVLLSFVVMTFSEKEISLYKASKLFIKNARKFFECINKKTCAISWLRELIGKFALKESRKNRPSTQLLLGWRAIYA